MIIKKENNEKKLRGSKVEVDENDDKSSGGSYDGRVL